MRQWRLIYDSPSAGVRTMAVDEAILMNEAALPTLRFYDWRPFCLSMGYGQRAADADMGRLEAAGYDLIRRPTGGRAILHGDELTYSVVLPADDAIAAGGILPSYQRISQALLAGLQKLGVEPAANEGADTAHSGPVCFETPSHYEVTVRGRKLIGSAQLRRRAGVLQHGSLPLWGDIGRICDVLSYPDEAQREAARAQVRAQAITLSDALNGRMITWSAAAEALVGGFREMFQIDFVADELSGAERYLAAQLAEEKYGTSEWTFRR